MSNNPLLYNAALSGAAGGLNNERWITSVNAANYVALRNAIVEFATAIDAAIPTDATVTQQDADLLQSICGNILSSRGAPGNAVSVAQAIATMFGTLRTQLVSVPIPPVSFLNWNTIATPTINADVLPAGHAPGFYDIYRSVAVKATTGAGTAIRVGITFTAPDVGLQTTGQAVANINNSTVQAIWNAVSIANVSLPGIPISIVSSGTAPISIRLSTTGGVNATVDAYFSIKFVGPLS